MATTSKRAPARSEGDAPAGGARLLEAAARAKGLLEERTVEVPIIGTITVAAITQEQHASLGINDDTDADEDTLRVVQATVCDPAGSLEDWATFRESAPIAVWGALVSAVMEANGYDPGAVRDAARRFRE